MAFMRCRGLHVARLRSRRGPVPARTHPPTPLLPSRLLRAQRRVRSRPPFLIERRRRRARSSLQKRTGHLAASLTVIPSTFSTPPSIQLCLGKGEIAVSFHRRHGRPAQEPLTVWRSCLAEATTSRVRAPEEGQCLPERTHRSIRFPLAFSARNAESTVVRHS